MKQQEMCQVNKSLMYTDLVCQAYSVALFNVVTVLAN